MKDVGLPTTNPLDLVSLLKGKNVYIQTHNCPDPDAIASAYGLQAFLKYFGINAICCYSGPLDRITAGRMVERFGIDLRYEKELDLKEDDAIVLVDSQKNNKNVTDLIGDEIACIDHHPTFYDCEYQYKDIRIVGACSSIIAEYYKRLSVPMDPMVASALTYGIKKDTANLSRGVTKLDLDMLSYLYNYSDWELIKSVNTNRLNFDDLRAYGAAIRNIQEYDGMGFAFIPFDCQSTLIAIISDFILGLDVVDVSVVYAMQKDCIRLSVRSERNDVSAGKLIRLAIGDIGDGGGHDSMGGGVIPKEFYDENKDDFEYILRERFMQAEQTLIEKSKE